ncbi:MAG: SDR family oxidoreductase [Streptosporangiaceae bacterium]
MASPVLVTGGTGRLGKLVVARLLDSGCDVRVLARHDRPVPKGVAFFTADLRTGQGIDPAVTAVSVIIHCATSTRGDARATRNLVAAASRTGPAHLVYVWN